MITADPCIMCISFICYTCVKVLIFLHDTFACIFALQGIRENIMRIILTTHHLRPTNYQLAFEWVAFVNRWAWLRKNGGNYAQIHVAKHHRTRKGIARWLKIMLTIIPHILFYITAWNFNWKLEVMSIISSPRNQNNVPCDLRLPIQPPNYRFKLKVVLN